MSFSKGAGNRVRRPPRHRPWHPRRQCRAGGSQQAPKPRACC